MSAYQIPLNIKLNEAATFDNYITTGNEQLVALLNSDEPFVYYWSRQATGKTHLAQALCHSQANSIYLPLQELEQWQPEIFEGLESFDLICLDDVEQLAGKLEWEEALFDLFNRLRDTGKKLRISAHDAPKKIGIQLPDLVSRLTWGVTIQVQELADEDKVTALSLRARQRGFDLPDEVAAYLLKHCPRDMQNLFVILDRLDDASLQAQRKLTIPFLKECLGL
ncbi:MAG: DnaA regulatory inactivator Hda [Thioalkalispiraceae bacterium]|jgi:DnaA family protein